MSSNDPTGDPSNSSAPAIATVATASASASAAASLHPLLGLLETAERELKTFQNPATPGRVGEAASDPAIGGWVRAFVYRLVQAQTRTEDGAIYNDLKCPVCMELFNNCSMHAGREKDVITIGCGHSACRGCLRQWRTAGHTTCPICRTAGVLTAASVELPKSICLSNIVERLKPRAPAGGSRKKQRKQSQRRSKKTLRK